MKSVRIQSFSGPCFPAFGPNTERYFVFLHIQSECGKKRTRKTPNTGNFHTVEQIHISIMSYCNNLLVKELFKFFGCFPALFLVQFEQFLFTAQKRSFPLTTFSVNVTKYSVSLGFGHIY